jgi:hypothetical protein
MRRLPTLTLLSAVILLAVPATASAQRPVVEVFSRPYVGSVPCSGGFNDNFQGTFSRRVTTFFDASGNPVTMHVRFSGHETDTNSVTGKTIAARQSFTVVIDLATGTLSYHGQVWMSNGGGQGSLFQDTGNVVFDGDGNLIKEAGPHEVLDEGTAGFCKALS